MNSTIEALRDYGADIDGAMGRFLGDAQLYQTCFAAFLGDEAFAGLGAALQEQDEEKAFEYAHTLKGVTGNMGLTPLYVVISRMVETLRKHEKINLQADYDEVLRQLHQLERMQ